MNIVDSSGWLEYFSDSDRASLFAKPVENTNKLLIPVVTLYEVFKKLYSETDENIALTAIAHMQMGQIIDLDQVLSLSAARISSENRIPMADSIIWATVIHYDAVLWTQDSDFQIFAGKNLKYFPK
ncbi:MAG: type II toxin-antitoxin system VapC family toxin [Leptospiraceae bacterium]|nr:type II toxin-antitoxin system VapC family toxin [Leptospiraceae bacterium]